MIVEWRGTYLDGRSARRRPAAIQITQSGLQFKTEDGATDLWSYSEIRQTQGFYAGQQIRLEKAGTETEALLLDDPEFLIALRRLVPGLERRFHRPERRKMRASLTIFAAFATLGLAAVLYFWAIPSLARVAAAHVPVEWEDSLGQSVVNQLAPAEFRCADPVVENWLTQVTARLARAAPGAPPYKIRVYVVRMPIVNAFAAPGGHIILFQGLIEQTDVPEELAGVLAHELEHVLQRHTTRMLLQQTSSGLILSALTGDLSGAIAFGANAAHTLGALRYSRTMEAEADGEGLRLMAESGIDPTGMITFFKKLEKKEGSLPELLAYVSSHPATSERIQSLESLRAEARPKLKPLPAVDWSDFKNRCRATDAESGKIKPRSHRAR